MSSDVAPKRAWEQVVEWVEERILRGELVVGSQLPAERDLAVRVGVSRPAVREAVRTLQASGVLRSSVGAGGAGGTTITGAPHQALTQLLRLHVALGGFPAADVTAVRVVLERLSCRLASAEATPEEIGGMRMLLVAMDDDTLSMEHFNDLDTELHVGIARAAGNRLATDLTVAIRESMRMPILAALGMVDDWTVVRAMLRAQHHGIVDAIDARDAEHAADLVEQHIRAAYANLPRLHQG